jgi:hypothetical protein
VPGAVLRRDPFVESSPPFDIPLEVNGEYQSSIPVMERFPLTDYEVVAVLLGDRYPRALVRLPEKEKRKVVVVKVRDKLGNRKGEIIKITREGLVVQQAIRSKFGFTDKSNVILKVGGTAEKQKAELMASQGKTVEKNSSPETSEPAKMEPLIPKMMEMPGVPKENKGAYPKK